VKREKRPPLFVVWEKRDVFSGEEQPPVSFEWPWGSKTASATDIFGRTVPATVEGGRARFPLSLTPVFLQ
jgi:hypothetical protein